MEFITVREASARWGISERLVQKLCSQGRIDGAEKFGGSWSIPASAHKPMDPRRVDSAPSASARPRRRLGASNNLMPLMNTPFAPGHCREFIDSLEDGPRKRVAQAEYAYFSGNAELADELASGCLGSEDSEIRLSSYLICAYANLTLGRISGARAALDLARSSIASVQTETPELKAMTAFIAQAASVLLHLPVPEGMPEAGEILPLLPPGLRSFALYVKAHQLYLQGEYEQSLGLVLGVFAMQDEIYPIPTIYLHLVAVMNLMSLRRSDEAREHLLAAWDIARPDDLIEGFGEHHGLLGGMLEAVIKPSWPEDFRRVIGITYRFSAGWRRVHNPDTGHAVADNLTTTEFAASMLAARGWTNREIAEHMGISANTVKSHISSSLQKLGIVRRRDLGQYMLA